MSWYNVYYLKLYIEIVFKGEKVFILLAQLFSSIIIIIIIVICLICGTFIIVPYIEDSTRKFHYSNSTFQLYLLNWNKRYYSKHGYNRLIYAYYMPLSSISITVGTRWDCLLFRCLIAFYIFAHFSDSHDKKAIFCKNKCNNV